MEGIDADYIFNTKIYNGTKHGLKNVNVKLSKAHFWVRFPHDAQHGSVAQLFGGIHGVAECADLRYKLIYGV